MRSVAGMFSQLIELCLFMLAVFVGFEVLLGRTLLPKARLFFLVVRFSPFTPPCGGFV